MNRTIGLAALLLAGTLPVVALSDEATATPEQIVMHHMSASAAGDVDGIISDYADNAVVIDPSGRTFGKAAIRKVFTTMFTSAAGSRSATELKQKFFAGNIGYITWVQNEGKPGEVRGSDTFIIRNGKIAVQTVAVVPLHPAP